MSFSVATTAAAAAAAAYYQFYDVSQYIFGWHGDSGVVAAAKKGRRAQNAATKGGMIVSGEVVSADLKTRGKKGEIINEQIAKTAAAAAAARSLWCKAIRYRLEKSTTSYINEYVMCVLFMYI